MTIFFRLIEKDDKAAALLSAANSFRSGEPSQIQFELDPVEFSVIPGSSFAYWVPSSVRMLFRKLSPFGSCGRTVTQGLGTADDFRFVRAWWEIRQDVPEGKWKPYAKGGAYSSYYSDVDLLVNWGTDGRELRNFADLKTGDIKSRVRGADKYFLPGFTYTSFTNLGFAPRVLPSGCIFSVVGMAIHGARMSELAILNSLAFQKLAAMTADHRAWQAGVIQRTPIPQMNAEDHKELDMLARQAWSLKHRANATEEISHAFILPLALHDLNTSSFFKDIEVEIEKIQDKIDEITFALYGLSEEEQLALQGNIELSEDCDNPEEICEKLEVEQMLPIDAVDGLLSWAVGVAFGRFDWRLAKGEHSTPPTPAPFDPLPLKSPGMLPDGEDPFYRHAGILVDDPGHPHDLVHLIEEVLAYVNAPLSQDVRRWLQREFFPFHLKQYSKSRRKAPIYWPLSTASGSYTFWVYYPALTSQTIYTVVNDFLDPKLKQLEHEAAPLRAKGNGRMRDEENQLEALLELERELIDMRDIFLPIAPKYRPNHDDGVQISAAPLWPLFQHKPWQKVLRDTWVKLKKGDFDWAQMAMSYWPDRVREKCKTDKSIAIAHDTEHLYIEPETKAAKSRGRNKGAIE